MKRYLKKRFKTYVSVVFGLFIGFIVVTFLFEKPGYKSALFAVVFGLVVGELFVFLKWLKDQRKEENF
jgi:uncharacterized membrane protein YqgA involved in biofilm formation